MGLPSVLVFTPIYEGKEYCLKEFMETASKLNYPNMKHIIIDNSQDQNFYKRIKPIINEYGCDLYYSGRGNNSREALARSENLARQMALKEGYDYLFSLESDIFPPKDIIQRLLVTNKDVISGLYLIGDENYRIPCITVLEWNDRLQAYGTRHLKPDEIRNYINTGIKQVGAAGMGCCLIHKNVFQKIKFTYDQRFRGHSDIYFFNDCFRNRIPVFVHTDIYCEHDNSSWLNVKDR